MRGSLGLVIGLTVGAVVGAAGMYLVLRPPWADGGGEARLEHRLVALKGGGSGSGSAAKPPKQKPGWRPQSGQRRPQPRPGSDDTETFDEPEPAPLTDADRRLEWRGDEVSVPPQKIDMAAGAAEARSLDDGEINATLGAQSGAVRDCIVQAAKGTDLRATITVVMLVDGNGRVSRSRVHAPTYLFGKGLLECTRRALSQMKFPSTGPRRRSRSLRSWVES